MKHFGLLVILAACSKPAPGLVAPSSETAPPPAGSNAAAATPPAAIECDVVCTDYAVCWEQVNAGEDYRGGGACVSDCEEMPETERREWAARVTEASTDDAKCKQLIGG